MVKRPQVKEWQHGTVVVGAFPLLHAQVWVNVTVEVPTLKAPGIRGCSIYQHCLEIILSPQKKDREIVSNPTWHTPSTPPGDRPCSCIQASPPASARRALVAPPRLVGSGEVRSWRPTSSSYSMSIIKTPIRLCCHRE